MQIPIAVRIRKGDDELIRLLSIGIVEGVGFKGFFALPESLDFEFGGNESVSFCGAFRGRDRKGGHFGGGGCHGLGLLVALVLVLCVGGRVLRRETASHYTWNRGLWDGPRVR